MQKMKMLEVGAACLALVLLVIIVLPMLARSREAARRTSCANNLKQLGVVLKMYVNESRGGRFPPLSKKADDWMMDMDAIYPEYLTDLSVLICPSNSRAIPDTFHLVDNVEHPGAAIGELHPDCVTDRFYTYTGYWLSGDEPALALYLAYHAHGRSALPDQDLQLPVPRWDNSGWIPGGSGGVVLWDRIPPAPEAIPHEPGGANVLSMDGSVQFVRYSPLNGSWNFPVTEMTTWTYGADLPRVSRDCY